jgi:hypothetical protein
VIAFDISGRDARKNFVAQHVFVGLRICSFRPPVPDACNHISMLLSLILVIVIVADGFVIDWEQEQD